MNFAARLEQTNLASRSDIANFLKRKDFYNKLKDVISNKNGLNKISRKLKQ